MTSLVLFPPSARGAPLRRSRESLRSPRPAAPEVAGLRRSSARSFPAATARLPPPALALVVVVVASTIDAAAATAAATAGADPRRRCRLSLSSGRVLVSEVPWLTLGPPCLRRGGREVCDVADVDGGGGAAAAAAARNGWSFEEGGGISGGDEGGSVGRRGRDGLGPYEEFSRVFVGWEVAARRYLDGDSSAGDRDEDGDGATSTTLIFEQRFLEAVDGTACPAPTVPDSARRGLASRFPVLAPSGSGDPDASPSVILGALRYSGNFMENTGVAQWSASEKLSSLGDVLDAGPVVLFTSECALVLSSASAFMSSGTLYDPNTNEMSFGVLGSVNSVPKGHSTSIIASSFPVADGPDAIRQALQSWGRKLMALHSTERRNFDATLRNLQFSTDNGAFYYYNTEKGMNYQQTIEHVKRVADQRGIPFRQWLMDSWWYHKGVGGGVKNWTAMPSVFPDGIAHVRDATRWDIVGHNRYFSSDTDYARQNGGAYDFVVEGNMALPLEGRFWDDLFANAKLWGLSTYEQDWLFTVSSHFNHTLQSVSAGRTWLVQMSDAAVRAGLPIQYCMPWPRHILQSVECSAVTQVRASDDYQPGSDSNWRALGYNSMLMDALGLAPTKDNFWSHPGRQEGSRYGDRTESAPRLHAAVSSLSRGPVAPSDRIDLVDADLMRRSCDDGGKLLRPDVPAARTDASLRAAAGTAACGGGYGGDGGGGIGAGRTGRSLQRARGDARRGEEVWSTHSALSGVRYTYILAVGTPPSFTIDAGDLYRSDDDATWLLADEYVAWDVDRPFAPLPFPLTVPPTNGTDFRLYGIAPVFKSGWAFLGEAEDKWVPVSGDRFSHLAVTEGGFSVEVTGRPGEDVRVILRSPDGAFHRVMCTVPPVGTTVLTSNALGCASPSLAKEQ